MFSRGSRYAGLETYTVTRPDGTTITVTRLPLPDARPIVGYHPHPEGERLDHIAARYLHDPTAFWQLCDANNSLSPDALGARPYIGVPPRKR
ncbi:MAG: hypothetical protein JWL77_3546 [Chthonomonadaceae bacterium]|nr:hypothetical protein [Chthonomonadaceae bacterium]